MESFLSKNNANKLTEQILISCIKEFELSWFQITSVDLNKLNSTNNFE